MTSKMDPNAFRSIHDWQSRAGQITICAKQLLAGRLTLVLGAGASVAYGLPMWKDLLRAMFRSVRRKFPSNPDLAEVGEVLLMQHLNGSNKQFATLVKKHLYPAAYSQSISLDLVRTFGLLTAVVALVSGRERGRIRTIVNFNVDDVIERFLGAFGLSVESVERPPVWPTKMDVAVLHPHGYLPHNVPVTSQQVVFAKSHFDERAADPLSTWHDSLVAHMSTHTCLFVGLSGDTALLGLLAHVKRRHIGLGRGDLFWGLRFSDAKADSRRAFWKERGVQQITVNSYSAVPDFLFEVCQEAAVLVRRSVP